MKICNICQKEFVPDKNKKYCSDVCKKKNKNDKRRAVPKTVKCQFCSVEFVQKRKDNITCGPACSQRLWAKNNPEKNWERYNGQRRKVKEKIWRKENAAKVKFIRKKYRDKKRATDELYKLKETIGNLIRDSFRKKGFKKYSRTEQIIGCSTEHLKTHIESKFLPWMNWKNHGLFNGEFDYGWDIDHIIPLSSAKNEADIIRLNHYTNLQPLCSKTNRYIKSGTVPT